MQEASTDREVEIRRAHPEDQSAARALMEELGYPSTPAAFADAFGDVLARDDHAVFIAAVNGHPSGLAHVGLLPSLEGGTYSQLLALVVRAEVRNLGLGARLLETVESWSRKQGCHLITLRSRIHRTDAHRFYERHGYERIKTQYAFTKRLT